MCRGFTLLELMVTIAVVAIMATIAVPSFRDLIQNNRVTTQTNELVTALNFARTEAVKRGRAVGVEVSRDGSGWTANVAIAGAADPLRVVNRQGSVVSIDDGEDATVLFGPTGVPTAGVTFHLQPGPSCAGEKRRRIAVGASGQITTTRLACAS
jgi:type IV fimbrial biogenesis protein FimT